MIWEVILECTVVRMPGAQTHPILGRLSGAGLLVHGTEGFSVTHVNTLGMRNCEIRPKSAAVTRVLVLGDSFTEAYQVGDAQTYCARAGAALRSRFGPGVEIVNGGRSGASPAYYLHLAEFYRRAVQPDSVVIQLDQGDFTSELMDTGKPFAVVRNASGFGTVKNDAVVSENPFTRLFPRLTMITSISTLRVASEKIAAMRVRSARAADDAAGSSASLTPVGRAALVWTIAELQRRYPRLALVYLPSINYSQPEAPPSEVEALLARAAAHNGVPFVNMRSDFIATFQRTHQPACGFNNSQPGYGHINALGHALVAARVTELAAARLAR
ncbi:MAG TPA: SGNH/GDSL hydrolase family protein [Chthonomonadaceae bacterium]|nr:SGNH/GDSL hydrolase family protein [Chthonomonadaceae bacterium]